MELEAIHLEVGYGEHVVIKDMDLHIASGRITTIIGPNGSGKSTVLKAMTRLIRFQQGRVTVGGEDILSLKPKALARRISVLPQMHRAPSDFRVKELVSYGRMPYQKMLSGLSREDEEIIRWAMDVTGTWQFRDKSIYEISGGETQRVWIATVLAQKPEIMFLDEPTTYLDIAHQLEMMKLIKKLNRETGIAIVMVLHDLTQAMEVSDHVVIIQNGIKYSEGRPEDVITPKMMREVYDVESSVMHVDGRSRPMILFEPIA